MKKSTFIGIDISKKTLDLAIKKGEQTDFFQIPNQPKAIRKFLNTYAADELSIGMENTGRHNFPLYEVLSEMAARVYVIPPLHLKKSLGLTRGKNDQLDAERILTFLQRNHQEMQEWKAPSSSIKKLKILLTERNCRVKMIRQLKSTNKEYELIPNIAKEEKLGKMNDRLIKSVQKQVVELEEKIERLIREKDELKSTNDLIRSVPGVGKILSWVLIAKTNNFLSISDPRKLACYSGVVPFQHQSGTSIRGRERVSVYADKSLKSLLHLGAMSAIRLDNDLRTYYKRKVNDGKNKMSALNAVRNKIVHRVFAVIRNQSEYINYSQLG